MPHLQALHVGMCSGWSAANGPMLLLVLRLPAAPTYRSSAAAAGLIFAAAAG